MSAQGIEPCQENASHVYFFKGLQLGYIKIGVARNVQLRLAALQIGSPDQLAIEGVIRTPTPRALEQDLHARFRAHRLHGEWFEPAPDLVAYIAKHGQQVAHAQQRLINRALLRREAASPGMYSPAQVASMRALC